MKRWLRGRWSQYGWRWLTLSVVLLGFAYAFGQPSRITSLSLLDWSLSDFSTATSPGHFLVHKAADLSVDQHQLDRQQKTEASQTVSLRDALMAEPVVDGVTSDDTLPPWVRYYLPKPDVAEVHAASLVATATHLVAFWYGGSREGSRDTRIFAADWPLNQTAKSNFSPLHNQPQSHNQQLPSGSNLNTAHWQNLRVAMTPQQVAKDQQRYIKKIGNAVPYVDARGVLWLMFVSVSIGGWAGSALNLTHSTDLGQTWSPVKRLVTSPFVNVSTLGRSTPLVYDNGDTLWPVYHEFIAKFAQGLHLDAKGNVLGLHRISSGRQGFQPSFVATGPEDGLALLRSVGQQQGRVLISRTENAGQDWSAPQVLPQINPDAAVDGLRLLNGDILWVYNDAPHSRHVLSLGLSSDQGRTWKKLCDLANDPQVANGHGFSYPSLVQDHTGRIHLLYSEGRHAIRHESFTPAWLKHWSEKAEPSALCAAEDLQEGTDARME